MYQLRLTESQYQQLTNKDKPKPARKPTPSSIRHLKLENGVYTGTDQPFP